MRHGGMAGVPARDTICRATANRLVFAREYRQFDALTLPCIILVARALCGMWPPHWTSMNPLENFHPLVSAWFTRRFPALTLAQEAGWPMIARAAEAPGHDVLLCAPTGSGKTLAAF